MNIKLSLFQASSLEVVVNTKVNVIAIKVYTPNVWIFACTIVFFRLPTSKTYVSYKTDLLVKVYSDTWFQTYWPFINWRGNCMRMVIVGITETTIDESIYILCTNYIETSIRCNCEIVASFTLYIYRVTFSPTNDGTNCNIFIDVITNLSEN